MSVDKGMWRKSPFIITATSEGNSQCLSDQTPHTLWPALPLLQISPTETPTYTKQEHLMQHFSCNSANNPERGTGWILWNTMKKNKVDR